MKYKFWICTIIYANLSGSTITYISDKHIKNGSPCLKDFASHTKYPKVKLFLSNCTNFYIDIDPTQTISLPGLILYNNITIEDAIKIANRYGYNILSKKLTRLLK